MLHYSGLLMLSVVLFLYGFFPIPTNNGKLPNQPPIHIGSVEATYEAQYKRMVLIVVDALRWDFATPELMPLTMGLVHERGCLSRITVESPTVTLPRIKALTTGSVPQYIDVIKNLATSELIEDSWLHSAQNKGLNMVFYGDNTWQKLFPKLFSRSEGTTSFFVWDFVEVDNNVTGNVEIELNRSDWDIMILHYLGLDHIGHVLGPFSPRIPLKLAEMDQIVHKIHKKTSNTSTMILVTGDHGMRDAGGHGGTSQAEITVPLIAIQHDCQNSTFQQTDIPANLAVLLGLNIPSTSIGNLQKSFLWKFNESQYLYALRYNTELLLRKDDSCRAYYNNATYFHEKYLLSNDLLHARVAEGLYQYCGERITKKLFTTSSRQDIPLLILVLLLLLNILIWLILNFINTGPKTLELICFGCLIGFLQYFSMSFAIIMLAMMGLFNVRLVLVSLSHVVVQLSTMNTFLVAVCILHPLTFISTSFIEEEHYFWLYFSISFIVLVVIENIRLGKYTNSYQIVFIAIFIRFAMDLNATVENSIPREDNWANILAMNGNEQYWQAFYGLALILVFFTITKFENSYSLHMGRLLILFLIFSIKCQKNHNALLGKVIWVLIFLLKGLFKGFSWQQLCILVATLLIKPHNVILIPIVVYTIEQIHKNIKCDNPIALTSIINMLSHCFYFLQGHRNSLADIDVSIGYIGLSEHHLIIVMLQLLMHTYAFPIMFHLSMLQHAKVFWHGLLMLRTSVILVTCIVMICFRHHLFVWSVFAPKLFIESVHTAFLCIEIWLWYLYKCINKFT